MLTFKIKDLLGKPTGSALRHDICEEVEFSGEKSIVPKSKLRGFLTLRKLPDNDISVELKDVKIEISVECSNCLMNFKYAVEIPIAERVYYFHAPKDVGDGEIFRVNTKNLTVDISEVFRQEILLHFPTKPVCSESCKGLCASCYKNLNMDSCECREKKNEKSNNPFKALKNSVI